MTLKSTKYSTTCEFDTAVEFLVNVAQITPLPQTYKSDILFHDIRSKYKGSIVREYRTHGKPTHFHSKFVKH